MAFLHESAEVRATRLYAPGHVARRARGEDGARDWERDRIRVIDEEREGSDGPGVTAFAEQRRRARDGGDGEEKAREHGGDEE